jgi:hypothetical protein
MLEAEEGRPIARGNGDGSDDSYSTSRSQVLHLQKRERERKREGDRGEREFFVFAMNYLESFDANWSDLALRV